MRWIHVRHEEAAAFAAGAAAQLTGQLTVCAGSCGPGNLHLINGLYDCHRSRVPVLAIAAQIPSAEIGSEHGLEFNVLFDVAPMVPFQPVVQYYANAGGGSEDAVVVGFRTKVEF